MVGSLLGSCLPRATAYYPEIRTIPKVLEDVFKEAAQGKEHMSAEELKIFLEKSQGDPVLTVDQAEALIAEWKEAPGHNLFQNLIGDESEPIDAGLDLAGFTRLLLNSGLNAAWKPKQMSHEMTAPLSQYFVHTSHNSYLTGNQLWSRSSVTPIIEALNEGCRVVELDCWEKRGRIKVLHGGTLTRPVSFEDCLIAIKENAFTASPYPVVITIENHLRVELQIEAAKILKEILGDTLFIPEADHRPPIEFLSPEALKGKIIISDKPLNEPIEEQVKTDQEGASDVAEDIIRRGDESPELDPKSRKTNLGALKIDVKKVEKAAKAFDAGTPDHGIPIKADEFAALLYIHCEKPSQMKEKQVKGGPLLSGNRAIMANLSEPQLKTFIKSHPASIIEYTKMNLGRVYPFGLRFDSSNADPMKAWSHGCQMAATNLQGRDRAAWLCKGFFRANAGCGYVKKPQVYLPESKLTYEEILNLPPKLRLKVKVLLGTQWHRVFDLFKKPDFYVRVAIKGIDTDTLRKQTKVAYSNKEPNWEDEEFEFPLRVPEIAVLRFEVWEDDRFNPDDFVGQCCLPVRELRHGIRVVPLSSKKGEERTDKLLCQFKLENLEGPVGNDTS